RRRKSLGYAPYRAAEGAALPRPPTDNCARSKAIRHSARPPADRSPPLDRLPPSRRLVMLLACCLVCLWCAVLLNSHRPYPRAASPHDLRPTDIRTKIGRSLALEESGFRLGGSGAACAAASLAPLL